MSKPFSALSCLAKPKSQMRRLSGEPLSSAYKMLDGLRSRWTTWKWHRKVHLMYKIGSIKEDKSHHIGGKVKLCWPGWDHRPSPPVPTITVHARCLVVQGVLHRVVTTLKLKVFNCSHSWNMTRGELTFPFFSRFNKSHSSVCTVLSPNDITERPAKLFTLFSKAQAQMHFFLLPAQEN